MSLVQVIQAEQCRWLGGLGTFNDLEVVSGIDDWAVTIGQVNSGRLFIAPKSLPKLIEALQKAYEESQLPSSSPSPLKVMRSGY